MGMLNTKIGIAGLLYFIAITLPAQDVSAPIHGLTRQWTDRLSVISGQQLDQSSLPLSRADIADFALRCQNSPQIFDRRDQAGIHYLLRDNNDYLPADSLPRRTYKSHWFRHFYPHKAHLFELNHKDFVLRADPILYVAAGEETQSGISFFTNQRGAEVRARIGEKIHFYTSVVETQERFPTYINRWINNYTAIPGNGLFKEYNSSVSNLNGYDFNNSSGYIAAPITKQVGFQFGHGRHFIGQGYRSMFLSDFSNNYLYLKLRSKFWKFTYENYFANFAESLARTNPFPNGTRRFAAFHHLNFAATKNWNIGIFEAVSYKRTGSMELQYFNPVILYRSVEHGFKSSDNILVGLDSDIRIGRRVKLYGQMLLDEFLFASLYRPEQKGWWGNKIATQLGAVYYNAFGVPHLDVRLEWNSATPYTYSHLDSLSNWTHFGQPLAHPLGANFREILSIATWQIHPKWTLEMRYFNMLRGDDRDGLNWGGDPNLTYNSRPNEYGNFIGQGDRSQIQIVGAALNWQLAHNIFLDARIMWRHQNNNLDARDLNNVMFGGGIRVNQWHRDNHF
jgi:hypothetical protein